MDIHKPKPVHGWRGFVAEIGVIVVGVLIALSAEQTAQALHWRHQVHRERESLRASAKEQLEVIVARQAQQPCVERRLEELAVLFQKHRSGALPRLGGPVGRPQNRSAGMEPWQLAVGSQAVAHMDLEERETLADAFSNYDNLHQMFVDADQSWIQLSVLDRPGDLEAGDWTELRRAYAQVRAAEDRIRSVIPYVLQNKNLGVSPPQVPLADALISPYSQAFCRPLLAP